MSVPIIEGMTELEGFTTFIQLNSETQQIEYLTELPSKGVKTATGAVGDGVIEYHGPLNFKIPDFQPNLTGGTKAGAELVEVNQVTTGYEVTTGTGTVTSVSLIEMLGAIFTGLGVGVLSYELNKDFWIDISNNLFLNLPGYVPITYDNIEDMSILSIFSNGKTYVDAELVQHVNNFLIDMGVYNQGESEVIYDIPTQAGRYQLLSTVEITKDNIIAMANRLRRAGGDNSYYTGQALYMLTQAIDMYGIPNNATYFTVDYSKGDVGFGVRYYSGDSPIDCYFNGSQLSNFYSSHSYIRGYSGYSIEGYPQGSGMNTNGNISDQSTYVGVQKYGNTWFTSSISATIVTTPTIPELPLLDGAVVSTTKDNLPQEQNLWWIHRKTITQANPETEILTQKELLPLTVPATSPKTNNQTNTETQAQVQTGTTPQTNTEPIADSPTKPFTAPATVFTPPTTPTITPTPTPSIPVVPAIGGQANKLFTVYNPSQANLDSLGATLWTQNIITQIVQMFTNNPMDAIISLHILYATPITGANKEIKLGYVPTGVSCPEVTNQYVNVDCGSVRVPELFGDARDYANTDISIYLPMIGFRQLKTEDAMASVISVDYKVDVFTGTVLATVTMNKGSVNQVFYTYEGNCAVNLPLTGADKSRQVATAVGAIGAMVTGSPLMALGSATAVAGGSARAQIQRSGNFTGNAGAMGCKKPYIIVSSDVPYDAAGYQAQYGYPANLTVMLGDCSGYVKVKEVHADAISNATEDEKRYIESQLKQGIIIH